MKTESPELDLGIKPDKSKSDCCAPTPCCSDDMDKPRYPELCFRGQHADLFRQKYGACAPGDEYTATFKLKVRVSADGENDYDKRIEFDVLSIIGDVVEEEPEEQAEGEDTANESAAKPMRKMGSGSVKKGAKEEAATY